MDTLEAGEVVIPRSARTDDATVLDVVAPEGLELSELLSSYCDATSELGQIPSWHYIVAAIGELYSEGELQARQDFAWELSPPVLGRALELAADEVSP